ncbi:MAG TPA: hypothetical protein VHR36_07105, partial [Pyrinomonadaceae bacterium]|nr:hypothetical protein [Pyrinomonadaceae bacterium]
MTKRGNHGDAVLNISDHKRKRAADLEDDVDALFQLPLAEFTGARNTLAAQLKKSGRGDESARVKALAKPTVSAWAVNQLYWDHRDQFDQLTALGQRFHKAQKSGKVAEMRTALESRREAISNLSDLATELLRDAGHNPAPDTIHRITTTLEGLSAYASLTDGPQPGRLTNDVNPPGFESLAGFSSGAALGQLLAKPTRSKSSQKTDNAVTNPQGKIKPGDDTHQLEDIRKAKITAARVSLQQAKKSL